MFVLGAVASMQSEEKNLWRQRFRRKEIVMFVRGYERQENSNKKNTNTFARM